VAYGVAGGGVVVAGAVVPPAGVVVPPAGVVWALGPQPVAVHRSVLTTTMLRRVFIVFLLFDSRYADEPARWHRMGCRHFGQPSK
jgi:hypothetical protein